MKKIDVLQRKDSALNKAAMSEPLFVLRANDPAAAAVVRYWALIAGADHEDGKIAQAYSVAASMEAWRKKKADEIEQELAKQSAAERQQGVNVKLDVEIGIDIQTPDGRIVHVASLDDLPAEVPQEVRDITQRLLDAKREALSAGGIVSGLDLRNIVGSAIPSVVNRPQGAESLQPTGEGDDLCDLCKAAGSEVCLGDILPESSMDILARGLGFTINEEQTKH